MPSRVEVGFLKTSEYGGTSDEGPFYFNHLGVSFLNLKVTSSRS